VHCTPLFGLKVPTWHEIQLRDSSVIALYLSKAANFDHFQDLLVSTLKILKIYDRLGARVGADERVFREELRIVRIRMEHVSLDDQPAVGSAAGRVRPPPSSADPALPPPPPSVLPKVIKLNPVLSILFYNLKSC